jgi:uncharacterized protein (TIGR03067 family)
MRRCLLLLLFLAPLAVWADDTDPEPVTSAEAELKKLQGNWDVVKVVRDGTDATKETKGLSCVIKKDQLTVHVGGGAASGRPEQKLAVTLDPKNKPAHIDLVVSNSKEVVKGIYKLEKGELTIAFSEPGQERPKVFDAKVAKGVLVLKKQKPK